MVSVLAATNTRSCSSNGRHSVTLSELVEFNILTDGNAVLSLKTFERVLSLPVGGYILTGALVVKAGFTLTTAQNNF
jgi:hypothetical protein